MADPLPAHGRVQIQIVCRRGFTSDSVKHVIADARSVEAAAVSGAIVGAWRP
jgi:hypothetical protein